MGSCFSNKKPVNLIKNNAAEDVLAAPLSSSSYEMTVQSNHKKASASEVPTTCKFLNQLNQDESISIASISFSLSSKCSKEKQSPKIRSKKISSVDYKKAKTRQKLEFALNHRPNAKHQNPMPAIPDGDFYMTQLNSHVLNNNKLQKTQENFENIHKNLIKRSKTKKKFNFEIPKPLDFIPSDDLDIYKDIKILEINCNFVNHFIKQKVVLRRLRRNTLFKSKNSIFTVDLEHENLRQIINDQTSESSVLLFSIPYLKTENSADVFKFKVLRLDDFECFYKPLQNNEVSGLRSGLFSKLLKYFPNRWENAKVPYSIDNSLIFTLNKNNKSIYNVIQQCLKTIESQTLVKFRSYNQKKHKSFLKFELGKNCDSLLGMNNGKNLVHASKNATETDIFHQIMHCLGFMHMHQKENKETVYYLSKTQLLSNTAVEDNSHSCIFGLDFGPFDYDSVLFMKSCEHMISYRVPEAGESIGLAESDVDKINFFYDNRNLEKEDSEIVQMLEKMKEKVNFEIEIYKNN